MTLKFGAAGLAAMLAMSVSLMDAGSASAEDAVLKAGVLSITTGPYAALGTEGENGLRLLLEENNYILGGTRIELEIADTTGAPGTALARAQELIARQGVDVVIGPLSSAEALAIHDYMDKAKVPLISHSALAEDLTQRLTSPWFVRATGTASQMSHIAPHSPSKSLISLS